MGLLQRSPINRVLRPFGEILAVHMLFFHLQVLQSHLQCHKPMSKWGGVLWINSSRATAFFFFYYSQRYLFSWPVFGPHVERQQQQLQLQTPHVKPALDPLRALERVNKWCNFLHLTKDYCLPNNFFIYRNGRTTSKKHLTQCGYPHIINSSCFSLAVVH